MTRCFSLPVVANLICFEYPCSDCDIRLLVCFYIFFVSEVTNLSCLKKFRTGISLRLCLDQGFYDFMREKFEDIGRLEGDLGIT